MSKSKDADVPTYAALGRLLGVTRQAAHKLATSPPWPFGPPPWPGRLTAGIRQHHAARRADANACGAGDRPVPLAVQAAELGMSMDALLKLHAAIDAGDYAGASRLLDEATDWDAVAALLA